MKRDCDKMTIGQKQTELFFPRCKFKVRLYVSSFSQKIQGREYQTYSLYVLSSLWFPSMEFSIWFWTNFLLKMMSPYMLRIRTELSVRTHFPLPSFINIIPRATLLDMKVKRGGIHTWAPIYQANYVIFYYMNFLMKSGFLIDHFRVSYNASRYYDPDPFYSHPHFLYCCAVDSGSPLLPAVFRSSLWMLRFFPGPHPNHFIFLSIFSFFISLLKTTFF